MAFRIGISPDADLAPLFFPFEAGWADMPAETIIHNGSIAELEKLLLAGELEVAPVTPLTYAHNFAKLRVLPTPVRAFDLASDSTFLICVKRPDQLESARVAVSPNSSTSEAILKLIAAQYYGLTPETSPVASEAAALEALQGPYEACLISGEAAMRAAGWAKAKGYFVEDLTKAWWIMSGLPVPLYLFAVRLDWIEKEKEAPALVRSLMLTFRRAILQSQEQLPTLLSHMETRTGLPPDALEAHYRLQRYDLNEAHLRGLMEFYRRAHTAGLSPAIDDLQFFPSLTPLAPAPLQPPRRSQPETSKAGDSGRPPANRRLKPVPNETEAGQEAVTKERPTHPSQRHADARARGLRVIKGGKDRRTREDNRYESDKDE